MMTSLIIGSMIRTLIVQTGTLFKSKKDVIKNYIKKRQNSQLSLANQGKSFNYSPSHSINL